MIAGVVISTAGGSMIWPFLLIYASGKLNLPLSTVATFNFNQCGHGPVRLISRWRFGGQNRPQSSHGIKPHHGPGSPISS